MKPVTDPTLLAQLDGPKPVQDPATLAQLEGNAPERSIVDQIGRALGRTVRAGVQGVTAIPNMIGDAVGLNSTASVRGLMDKIGLPKAENSTERVAEDVASGMAGAGGMVGLGKALTGGVSPIVQKIGEMLTTGAGTQVVSSGTGAAAAGVAREEGASPAKQMVAGIAGTLAPSVLSTSLAEATRRIVRGGEDGRQRVSDNIQAFKDAGAGMPTVGQATETRGMRAIESGLSKTPGAAGRMIAKGEAEALGLSEKVDDMASSLATRTGAAPAGMEIRGGLKRFAQQFKDKAGSLYDELDTHIAPDSPVQVGRTAQALDELTALKPGAEAISGAMVNPKIAGWKAALAKDAQNGTLPYSAIKDLRSKVGELLSDSGLVADAPRAQLKRVYSALTDDMTEAARVAGPDAEKALSRANTYYAAGMKRIDDVLDPILKKTDPEDIYKAAISGTNEGATTIRGVMKSLPEESRKVVAATTLKRLGKAVSSKQDDLGEVFSPETFLTNWNKLTPDAKNSLFSALPGDMRKDLDKIARVASNLRDGSKVFANPSGTAQAATNQLTAGAAVLSLLTGNAGAAGAIAAGVVGANAASRIMTNPLAVRWLAESTRVPVEQLPAQLNNLSQTIFRMDKDEREDAREFVRQARALLSQETTTAAGTGRQSP